MHRSKEGFMRIEGGRMAQIAEADSESISATITQRDIDFPVITRAHHNEYQKSRGETNISLVGITINPREKSMKVVDREKVITSTREFLREKMRIFAQPATNSSTYIGFKFYNIDQPITLSASVMYSDFKRANKVVDTLQPLQMPEGVSLSSSALINKKYVAEVGFELGFTPYDLSAPFEYQRNECIFSLIYESSLATCSLTILVLRIADSSQVQLLLI